VHAVKIEGMGKLACIGFLLSGLVFAASTAKTNDPVYAPLFRYVGTWQISRANMPAGSKPDTLINDCALVGRYFACQQTVNSSPGGLVVYIPTNQPGHFYTQTILPEGRATGRDELEIAGDQWTYTSRRDQNGRTTFYRTRNTFAGKNRIHFEQAESNNGKDWTVQNSGDEVRLGPNGKPLS
jgi:hypothetical protein